MERYTRLVKLHGLLLSHQRPVPRQLLEERLDCSRATFNRVLDQLRDLTRDAIPYHREENGYAYTAPERVRDALPFVGIGPEELNALLVIDHHLERMVPGVLGEVLAPLGARIRELLTGHGERVDDISRRIRILPLASRNGQGMYFPLCARAVLQRNRLDVLYRGRTEERTDHRELSPQRLVHYRDNWYLDAWCHLRNSLRSFAVERIVEAKCLDQPALEIAETDLDGHFATAYGIFGGAPQHTAVLRFSPQRARWVADEIWHPQQYGQLLADGYYELRIPYSNPTELILDILRYGPDVEVLAPEALRMTVVNRLQEALKKYVKG